MSGSAITSMSDDDFLDPDSEAPPVNTITGTAGDDVVDTAGASAGVTGGAATAGNDEILGLDGNDTLSGGAGDDVILGGTGADALSGEGGNDTLWGNDGADILLGGEGDDSLYGAADQYNGTDTSSNTLFGGTGNDTLIGSRGDDTLYGEDGNDSLHGDSGADFLSGGAGDDVLDASIGITGDSSSNTLTGGEGNDTLYGSSGDDLLAGGAGADNAQGGGGNDTFSFDEALSGTGAVTAGALANLSATAVTLGSTTVAAATALDPSGSTDTFRSIENVVGTARADRFWGNDRANTFTGNGGSDSFYGGAGNDRFIGTADSSSAVFYRLGGLQEATTGVQVNLSGALVAGIAARTGLDGQGGTDSFGTGIRHVGGTSFADVLVGDGSLTLYSYLNGGQGADALWAGAINDFTVASYSGNPGGITANLAAGTVTDGWGDVDTLNGVRHVLGSGSDDVMNAGGVGGNFIASLGNDSYSASGAARRTVDYRSNVTGLEGGVTVAYATMTSGTVAKAAGGTDTLAFITDILGTAFADSFTGPASGASAFTLRFRPGAGNDAITASGNGRIAVDYSDATKGIIANLATGVVSQDGFDGADTLTGVLRLRLSNHDDTVTGSAGNDTFEVLNHQGSKVLAGAGGFDAYRFQGPGKIVASIASGTVAKYDTLGGLGGTDQISGMEYLVGGDGNDTLNGGSGNENFHGGRGTDLINGGDGVDFLQMDDQSANAPAITTGVRVNLSGGDVVAGGVTLAANTAIDAWGTSDTVLNLESVGGTAFADILVGVAGATPSTFTFLNGNNGADTLVAPEGATRVVANYGNDVDADASGITADLGAGTATDGWGNADTLIGIRAVQGGAFKDSLTGSSAGGELLLGQGGDDTLSGGGGGDTLNGGDGNDTLTGGFGTDSLFGGAGNDLLDAGSGGVGMMEVEFLSGGTGDDVYAIRGGSQSVYEAAGEGADVAFVFTDGWTSFSSIETLSLQGTATRVNGGTANEVIYANATLGSNIFAGNGNDTLIGGSGTDTLGGGDGNDTFFGNGGNDTFFGGNGDDLFFVSTGGTFTGEVSGGGTDTALVNADAWTLTGNVEAALLYGAGRALATVTAATLASFADAGTTLAGSGGDDTLYGGTFADTLYGNSGKDWLIGGGGADRMEGGAGDDLYVIADATDLAVEFAGSGADVAFVSTDGWTAPEFLETAVLTDAARVLSGGGGAQVLIGNAAGGNTLDGGAGNDTLVSSAFGDTLVGGAGDDVISAAGGADVFLLDAAGFGGDLVTGAQAGAFALRFAAASGITAMAQVTVIDFGFVEAFSSTVVQAATAEGTITFTGLTGQQVTDAITFA